MYSYWYSPISTGVWYTIGLHPFLLWLYSIGHFNNWMSTRSRSLRTALKTVRMLVIIPTPIYQHLDTAIHLHKIFWYSSLVFSLLSSSLSFLSEITTSFFFFPKFSFLKGPWKQHKANSVNENLVCWKNKFWIQIKEVKLSW